MLNWQEEEGGRIRLPFFFLLLCRSKVSQKAETVLAGRGRVGEGVKMTV
jgi:hypothetical protein